MGTYLGQISGRVGVDSIHQGQLVRNQLQRQNRNKRGQRAIVWDDNGVEINSLGELGVISYDVDPGSARLNLREGLKINKNV